ncbi:SDR family oxidoreductase [candidate division KSB1 bacterium]|nr:SDR family oxidoreductase [candidate division KSB1 bacterium]
MKKIFITGAGGLLGGHVYRQAVIKWRVLAGYYRHKPENRGGDRIRFDLTDSEQVRDALNTFRPDVMIHCAASSNLDECEKNPATADEINVKSVEYLVSAANDLNSRLIFISSDMVFDGEKGNYRETDPVSPLSVYGRTKVRAEEALARDCKNYVIARAALIYGRPATGGSSFSMWIENRLKTGSPVSLYTDQFRTPVLADNLAEALLELAENDYTGVIHLGGANRIDRYTFGKQLCAAVGYDESLLRPGSMHDDSPAAPRPADVSLNTDRAASVLRTRLLNTTDGLRRMCGA